MLELVLFVKKEEGVGTAMQDSADPGQERQPPERVEDEAVEKGHQHGSGPTGSSISVSSSLLSFFDRALLAFIFLIILSSVG